MALQLSVEEIRVLASLMEKSITTPEYYPLSLNALVNACNQKSCRDPVLAFDDAAVARALESLREKQLVASVAGADARVPKYKERLAELFAFDAPTRAVLAELMLRGPQTVAELRSRSERMHAWGGAADVQRVLEEAAARPDGPWVVLLPRQPGRKEARYAHLLGGPVAAPDASPGLPPEPAVLAVRQEQERLAALEQEVARLRGDLDQLRQQLAEFRNQFS